MDRVGSRTLIATGALIAAGFWWQSEITADSRYLAGHPLPAIAFSPGSGLLNDAGTAAGLMNTTKQFDRALGLAVLVTFTAGELATPQGLAAEYGRAIAVVLLAVAAVSLATGSGLTCRARPRALLRRLRPGETAGDSPTEHPRVPQQDTETGSARPKVDQRAASLAT
ncbi:hypothetical protein AB0H34_46045 [Saccharopolyspora shandongensis]|uniref:hypothetical protein n=1 Tax=Saccharopolyspora shandongensis TaxID=418495 RepID=UPI0033EF9ABC